MKLEALTNDELHALWDALQQYVDNNDPEECGEKNVKLDTFKAAQSMLSKVDAYVASAAGPTETKKDLEMPAGLSADGQAAYKAIMAVLNKHEQTYTGGCRAFYSPAEWKARGEEYGTEAELIVVYDGGALRPFFSMDAAYDHFHHMPAAKRYDWYEEMQAALGAKGLYFEECTGWYCAVFKR
jgi:hypothetical protein